MAEPRRPIEPGHDELERALTDLGRRLAFPPERDIVPAVRARLLAASEPRPSFRSRLFPTTPPGWPRRQLAVATLAVLLAFVAVLALSPETRTTIAERIGLPGVSISTGPAENIPVGAELRLGDEAGQDDAIEQAGYPAVLPAPALGDPDAVYILQHGAGAQLSYVYRPDDELPEVGDTGVGLLISQFVGKTNESFIQKQLRPGTTLEVVAVNGQRAFWIAGEPHVFYYEDAAGDIQEETIRLAGNVLLWEHDGKTLRIESALPKDEAIRLAESMTAASD